MVHINEELKAAKAAKAAINVLLRTTTPKSAVVAPLHHAYRIAALHLSTEGPLNEARKNAGIALSNPNSQSNGAKQDRQG
jgi:hypothetical protein